MKITVYTINDCPFCKQEKEYLGSKLLAFEEKNLESNKEYLTEMLAISSNFAGAPVTKIEKDDGQISVLKGFTQEEFDKTLGMSTPAPLSGVAQAQAQMTPPPVTPEPQPAVEPPVVPPPPVEMPSPPPPTMPEPPVVPPSTPPVAEAQSQITPPPPLSGVPTSPNETPVTTPPISAAPQADEALNSILNDLQKKVSEMPPQQPQSPSAPVV